MSAEENTFYINCEHEKDSEEIGNEKSEKKNENIIDVKENFYGKLDVSLETMDRVVFGTSALLLISLAAAFIMR
ncbi:MAG: hypothetical protein HFE62_05655 [Firmicutes bacterium]|nr:hypothetical protein [Bacillota bacterium]